MTYLITAIAPTDRETFDKVTERVESQAHGLIARYTGTTDRGIAITAVWESKAHADRFTTEHLVPAIREIAGDGGGAGLMIDFEAFDEYHGTTSP